MENVEVKNEENVSLNGQVMSSVEFEEKKKNLTEKKIQIVEVSKNNYVTRMLD